MSNFGAQNMVSPLKKVLMKKPQKFMAKVNKKKWNYISPLDQNLLNENYKDFYKIIKKFGTEIMELQLENENEELCDSVFTHDPSLVLDEGAIIFQAKCPLESKMSIKQIAKKVNQLEIKFFPRIIENILNEQD